MLAEFADNYPALAFLVYVAIMSLVTFMAYGIDKKKAIDGAWRTKEKTLLGLSLAGGAVGGFLGMKLFRHKTKHTSFTVGIPAILLAQMACAGAVWYFLLR